MLFTIAIPTYNNAKTVSKAIESAINQDYKDEYEVLIVNNASTDETVDILAPYKNNPKVRIETNEATVDLFANHNVCFEKAKGDYVLFIHSDDELMPWALKVLNNKLEERMFPPRYIVWGRSAYFDYQRKMSRNQPINIIFGGETAINNFVASGLTPSGTCYSRKSILEIGGFPKMMTRSSPMDWYLMIWASFNFFEFEMIDRLLFKRLYSSTEKAGGYQNHDALDVFNVLLPKLTEYQKNFLLDTIRAKAPVYVLEWLKPYYSNIVLIKKRWVEKFRKVLLG